MMADIDLVKAFHEEMLAFVDRHVDMTRAFYEEGLDKLSDDDLVADNIPDGSICVKMREQDRDIMADLYQRFEAANIGDWNEHMKASGAWDLNEKLMSYLPLEDGPVLP